MDIGADTVRDQLLMLARIVEANLPNIDGELVQLIDQLKADQYISVLRGHQLAKKPGSY